MKTPIAAIKITMLAITIFIFIVIGSLIQTFFKFKPNKLILLSKWSSFVCRICLGVARVNTKLINFNPAAKNSAKLVVANHMGMLDILLISRFFPSIFVTSYELKETPLVGYLTQSAGCVFVERRSRSNIHNEVKNISAALSSGASVVVFPEAMSTNGDKVHPFKKSLFVAAADAAVEIQPITINYLTVDGNKVNSTNRDQLCWYGDQSFHGALWRMMKCLSCDIELIFHPTLKMSSSEERHQISQQAFDLVSSRFQSLSSDDSIA
jgi:lyso-ornithine lipid O-acyltransferase